MIPFYFEAADMRTLGEQWVENGRMYKAVEGPKIVNGVMEGNTCHGCCHIDKWDDDCLHFDQMCPVEKGLIVKDLGPVNEDGVLAEERTGRFPTLKEKTVNGNNLFGYYVVAHHITVIVEWFSTKQEAIDAWNRRV